MSDLAAVFEHAEAMQGGLGDPDTIGERRKEIQDLHYEVRHLIQNLRRRAASRG